MIKYKINDLKSFVENAVQSFLEEAPNLLDDGSQEQAITHRVAVYLEREFNDKDLNFDCEYNRHLDKSKSFVYADKIDCPCKSCKNRRKTFKIKDKKFRPDILVHKRKEDCCNLIAIEVKRDEYCKFDEEKIIALTSEGDEYKYQLGLCLHFKDRRPMYKWFSKGKHLYFHLVSGEVKKSFNE